MIFFQSNTPTAGLNEGKTDIADLRRPLDDRRFSHRAGRRRATYAALPADDPLARRRTVTLNDFVWRTIGIYTRTGTTTEDLWSADAAPAGPLLTSGVYEWLRLIAAGQAIGITSRGDGPPTPAVGNRLPPGPRRYRRFPCGSPGGNATDRLTQATLQRLICEAYDGES